LELELELELSELESELVSAELELELEFELEFELLELEFELELELEFELPMVKLSTFLPAALHPSTKAECTTSAPYVYWTLGGAQTLTVQGRLAARGIAGPTNETVDTLLQLFAVLVCAEAVDISTAVQIVDGVRAGGFALSRTLSALGGHTNHRDVTNLRRDNIRVDDLSPGNQGGVDRKEWRTFFEFGGRDCGQRSIRDALYDTSGETTHL